MVVFGCPWALGSQLAGCEPDATGLLRLAPETPAPAPFPPLLRLQQPIPPPSPSQLSALSTFSTFSCRDNKGGLTLGEIWTMTEGNRVIFDPTGWTAAKMEWLVSYYLFADDDVSTPALHSDAR